MARLLLQEDKSEINKKEAANRDLKLEIKNVEVKQALPFKAYIILYCKNYNPTNAITYVNRSKSKIKEVI